MLLCRCGCFQKEKGISSTRTADRRRSSWRWYRNQEQAIENQRKEIDRCTPHSRQVPFCRGLVWNVHSFAGLILRYPSLKKWCLYVLKTATWMYQRMLNVMECLTVRLVWWQLHELFLVKLCGMLLVYEWQTMSSCPLARSCYHHIRFVQYSHLLCCLRNVFTYRPITSWLVCKPCVGPACYEYSSCLCPLQCLGHIVKNNVSRLSDTDDIREDCTPSTGAPNGCW